MLFYPVHFRGLEAHLVAAARVARLLPHKLRQVPGIMIGGDRLAGDRALTLGEDGESRCRQRDRQARGPRGVLRGARPREDRRADRGLHTRNDIPEIVERVMQREHPQLWNGPSPSASRPSGIEHVQRQLPRDRARSSPIQIAEHIDQLVDVKLMVIKRFDPELANRVFLDMGRRELKFIQNFGFFFGFVLGIPVAVLTHFVTFWWLLPDLRRGHRLRDQLGRAVDDLQADRDPVRLGPFRVAGAVHPPPARGRRRVREHRRRRDPHGLRIRQRAPERSAARTGRER